MAKRIGILGGMSPESTSEYYEYITRTYTERYGDFSYPEIIIYSVSFQPYVDWPNAGRWDLVATELSKAVNNLEKAGADFAVIATNTMHIVFDEIQSQVSIPMISLLDAVGKTIQAKDITRVGLLGTRFTMQNSFYPDALQKYNVEVVVPEQEDADTVHNVIYDELVKGIITPASKEKFLAITKRLEARGAQGVILGCTEIPLLINNADTRLPLFDTTTIHAEAALNYSLDT